MKKEIAILVFAIFAMLSGRASALVREIAVPNLPDLAIASYDRWGPVIYYNPILTRIAGPLLTEFFRAHEYGHHRLGHVRREFFESDSFNRSWERQKYEQEADCFAAKHVSTHSLEAALQFFSMAQGASRPDWYHPSGYERAVIIRACAGL